MIWHFPGHHWPHLWTTDKKSEIISAKLNVPKRLYDESCMYKLHFKGLRTGTINWADQSIFLLIFRFRALFLLIAHFTSSAVLGGPSMATAIRLCATSWSFLGINSATKTSRRGRGGLWVVLLKDKSVRRWPRLYDSTTVLVRVKLEYMG